MKHHVMLAALGLLALLPAPARASEGHDHGDAAPAATGPASPRFAAVSETFELVGVLNGKQITLYLDRAADNSPVAEAQIELELAGRKFKASRHGEDAFEVLLPEAPQPGLLPVTATVTAGAETDLLAGELDIHEHAHADAAPAARPWLAYAGWAVAGLALLALLVVAARRGPRSGSPA